MKKMVLKFIILIIATCLCSILIYYKVERANKIDYHNDIIESQLALETNFLQDTNYTIDNPKIIVNPYGISPLTALIIFNTNDLTSPTVTIKGKDDLSTYTNTFAPAKNHYLPIYGLYPDLENEVVITLDEIDYTFKIKTSNLPSDFNLAKVNNKNTDELTNDLYFLTPSSKGYVAAYDTNGDVRWYLTDRFIWDIQRLKNGHILLSSNRLINNPYYMTGLMEMDLLGKVYYEYNLPGGYHHDAYEMPNGNFLVASDNFDGDTVEDYIVEINRNTGEIVKKIDLKDILPTTSTGNENYTEYDWFHNNSVWYDEKTNSITLSGRHQDAVVNIDYTSNEINFIIGDKTNWDKNYQKYFFNNDIEWQYSQHAAMILPNGNVFLFDNGNNRSKNKENYISAENNYSRAVIYKINNKNITQVWQYGKERKDSYYSPYISDVDYLDDNHYLVHSGGHVISNGKTYNNAAGLTEDVKLSSYTTEIKNDEVVFELYLPSNYYRAEKLSLYANDVYVTGSGNHLGSFDETKTDGKFALTLFNKNDKDIIKKYNLNIYEEYDRLVVNGTFEKSDEVEIILDSVFKPKYYNMIISNRPYTALCVDLNTQSKNNKINAYKYINKLGLSGKYYIYIKINGKVYDLDKYIEI